MLICRQQESVFAFIDEFDKEATDKEEEKEEEEEEMIIATKQEDNG